MAIKVAAPEHEVAYQDLVALSMKHATTLTPIELLAIAANMVGKLLAMQDQRTTSKEVAIETIMLNIENGNAHVVQSLMNNTEGRS